MQTQSSAIPVSFRTLLGKLAADDRDVAEQVLTQMLDALNDPDASVSSTPYSPTAGYGFALTQRETDDLYTMTVMNCAAVSMRMLHEKVWRHESVCEVTVENQSRIADRPGLTVTIVVARARVRDKKKHDWLPPADAEDQVDEKGTSGLLVPPTSRRDALTVLSAFLALTHDTWHPHFFVTEDSAISGSLPAGYTVDVNPITTMSLSFYVYLDEALGRMQVTPTSNPVAVLRNITLWQHDFNGTQKAMKALVSCRTQPLQHVTGTSSPSPVKDRRADALRPRGGIASKQESQRGWRDRLIGMFKI